LREAEKKENEGKPLPSLSKKEVKNDIYAAHETIHRVTDRTERTPPLLLLLLFQLDLLRLLRQPLHRLIVLLLCPNGALTVDRLGVVATGWC
jgi:hypothetical protein